MENEDAQKIIKILEQHGKRFDEQDELLHFICETVATKDELGELKKKMNERFDVTDSQLSGIKVELVSIGKDLEEIKSSLKKLEDKTQEDDDAMISEIEKLKQRVAVLERELVKVRQMQPA
ncbi:MAG: hypothetical protein HY569_01735 [Candidatus Magasanikbacteria bacterium]|nr:hypothetical protein [Candidatus Magasanikbacteria bacterium]